MTSDFVTKFAKFADPTLIDRTSIPKRIKISQCRWGANSGNDFSTSCENFLSFGPVLLSLRGESVFIVGSYRQFGVD